MTVGASRSHSGGTRGRTSVYRALRSQLGALGMAAHGVGWCFRSQGMRLDQPWTQEATAIADCRWEGRWVVEFYLLPLSKPLMGTRYRASVTLPAGEVTTELAWRVFDRLYCAGTLLEKL